jgi:hypothetical protein
VSRSIEEIEAEIDARIADRSLPDTLTPALQAELLAARANEAVAERIASQRAWRAMQQDESERCRLNLEQLQFLVSEADAEIAKLTTTGDELNSRVVAGEAAVRTALVAGDTEAASRNQEIVNTAGQALRQLPPMIATVQANRDAAAAQLPAAEHELELPLFYVRSAEAEIARLSGLPDGEAWDEPHPAPPREIPSVLSLAQRMAIKTRIEDNEELLKVGRATFEGEPRVLDRERSGVRRRARGNLR